MNQEQLEALKHIDRAKQNFDADAKRLGDTEARLEYKKLIDHANSLGLGTNLDRDYPDGASISKSRPLQQLAKEEAQDKPLPERPLGVMPPGQDLPGKKVEDSPEGQKIKLESQRKLDDLQADQKQQQIDEQKKLEDQRKKEEQKQNK